MKNRILKILFAAILITALFPVVKAQTVLQIKVPELEKLLSNKENTLFVINFWATWCPPCIKELPHFQKVSEEIRSENVKFIFVSLDFPSQIESQLIPFLKKNQFPRAVSVMMDLDYNKWIASVDPSWQGNIPATLFLNNSKNIRKFHSSELSENELRTLIKQLL
jgi:thiol-disulfide isomerase/thioredoxin